MTTPRIWLKAKFTVIRSVLPIEYGLYTRDTILRLVLTPNNSPPNLIHDQCHDQQAEYLAQPHPTRHRRLLPRQIPRMLSL